MVANGEKNIFRNEQDTKITHWLKISKAEAVNLITDALLTSEQTG